MKTAKRIIILLAILAAVGAGILVGVIAHQPIGRALGFGSASIRPAPMVAAKPQRKILYWWDPMLGPSSISRKPGISAMGMKLVPVYAGSTSGAAHVAKRRILYWWDPMLGPSSISSKPGISAMGMKLIPVYASDTGGRGGEVRVDPGMVQDMGIQTAKVTLGPLFRKIRVPGQFRVADPQRYAVTLRVSGWIQTLYAATNGTPIHKGQRLFTLYSPMLLAAEQELISAERAVTEAKKTGDSSAVVQTQNLMTSVRKRLEFLGVDSAQVGAMLKSAKASAYLTFYSPADGVLMDVKVQQRSGVKIGQTIMSIERFNPIWFDARVFDNQISWIKLGQRVESTTEALTGKTLTGKIIYIAPYENPVTHTTVVRAAISNSQGNLRPGMYAMASIKTMARPEAILIPREAVLETGTRAVVFVQISPGHFDPVNVKIGLVGSHGLVQVISGLGPGQRVVVSGEFLIDVESRIKEAGYKFRPKPTVSGGKTATTMTGSVPH